MFGVLRGTVVSAIIGMLIVNNYKLKIRNLVKIKKHLRISFYACHSIIFNNNFLFVD